MLIEVCVYVKCVFHFPASRSFSEFQQFNVFFYKWFPGQNNISKNKNKRKRFSPLKLISSFRSSNFMWLWYEFWLKTHYNCLTRTCKFHNNTISKFSEIESFDRYDFSHEKFCTWINESIDFQPQYLAIILWTKREQ